MTSVADRLAQKTSRKTASKQVRLRLVHIDYWSVVKLSLLLAGCALIIGVVVTLLLWLLLEQTGVINSVNQLLNDVSGNKSGENAVTVDKFINLPQLLVFSLGVGALNFIVYPALAAVCAFLYNLTVRVTGGVVFGYTNG